MNDELTTAAGAPPPLQPDSPPPPGDSARTAAVQGWASPLAITVTAWLVLQGATGLWIYLAPFSATAQVQVLIHTSLGILLLLPYIYYQTRHWLVWWRQKVTPAMVMGYALLLALVVTSVTGVVLTWQASLGPRISRLWDLIHLVSGLAATGLLAAHLLAAYLRRRLSARGFPELARAQWRFARWSLASVLLASAGIGGLSWAVKEPPRLLPPPEGYSLPQHAQSFEEYRGNPFAPSYARTETLAMVPSELLAGSTSCGTAGCHEEILAEWEPSAHRFSAMNPPFQAVQKNFAADRGAAETRYCAGCHDPISLFAGAKDIHNLDLSAPGMQEGISCVVCHSISLVDQRGNADYVLVPPRKYLWEGTTGARKFVSDFLIRAFPRQHLADYDRNVLRTPEYCGACHKQFIPEALNRFGFVQGQNQYDEWRKSHWNADDPDEKLSCRDCHMRLVRGSSDPGHGERGDTRRTDDDGAHRHHGCIGANIFMPQLLRLPHWERHFELTTQWLRGEAVLPEIADVYPPGPVAAVEIVAPEEAAPGEAISLRVVVSNRKAGHNFTTGPQDFLRAWIHLQVRDEAGSLVAEWGAVDPVTRRVADEEDIPAERRSMLLAAMPIDEKGEPLRKHELWRMAGGKGKRVIFPGFSDTQVFQLSVPAGAAGALHVHADLDYRRYRQEFLDLTLPDLEKSHGVFQPIVTQTQARKSIRIARAGGEPAAAGSAGASGGGR